MQPHELGTCVRQKAAHVAPDGPKVVQLQSPPDLNRLGLQQPKGSWHLLVFQLLNGRQLRLRTIVSTRVVPHAHDGPHLARVALRHGEPFVPRPVHLARCLFKDACWERGQDQRPRAPL